MTFTNSVEPVGEAYNSVAAKLIMEISNTFPMREHG